MVPSASKVVTHADKSDIYSVTMISGYRLHLLIDFVSTDFTYNIVPVVVWSYVEIVIGLVSACLPVSKPAVLWVTNRLGITGNNGFLKRLGLLRTTTCASSDNNTAVNSDAPEGSGRQSKLLSTSSASGTMQSGSGDRSGTVGNSRYFLSGDTLSSDTMVSELMLMPATNTPEKSPV